MYSLAKKGGIEGKIEYRLWYILKRSAAELFSFGLFYLVLAILMGSWFFFSGAVVSFYSRFSIGGIQGEPKNQFM